MKKAATIVTELFWSKSQVEFAFIVACDLAATLALVLTHLLRS